MTNNRSLLVGIVALASSVTAHAWAGERTPGNAEVRVARFEIHLIDDPAVLGAKCRSRAAHACTAFEGEGLVTTCVARGGEWEIDAGAKWKPVMYFGSMSYFEHEMLHVADVTRLATAHIRRIVDEHFGSESACENRAEKARVAFPAFMNGFRARSNAVRK